MKETGCCAVAKYHDLPEWRKAGKKPAPLLGENGPLVEGWAIPVSTSVENDHLCHYWVNITFCPWCGKKLPDQPVEV